VLLGGTRAETALEGPLARQGATGRRGGCWDRRPWRKPLAELWQGWGGGFRAALRARRLPGGRAIWTTQVEGRDTAVASVLRGRHQPGILIAISPES